MKQIIIIAVMFCAVSCKRETLQQETLNKTALAANDSQITGLIRKVTLYDTTSEGRVKYTCSYTYNAARQVTRVVKFNVRAGTGDEYNIYYDSTGRVDSVYRYAPRNIQSQRYKYVYDQRNRLAGIVRFPHRYWPYRDTMTFNHEPQLPAEWNPPPTLHVSAPGDAPDHFYTYDHLHQLLQAYRGTGFSYLPYQYEFKNTIIANPEYAFNHKARLQDLAIINHLGDPLLDLSLASATLYDELHYKSPLWEKFVSFRYSIELDGRQRVSRIYYITGSGALRLERDYEYLN